MPACLVLTYWAGRQTCIDIKRGTLKRPQLLSPFQTGINNKLCLPSSAFHSSTNLTCVHRIRSTPKNDNTENEVDIYGIMSHLFFHVFFFLRVQTCHI